MTPAEVVKIVNAHQARDLQDYEQDRMIAHEAAQLAAFAHHDPSNLPKYRSIADVKNEEVSDAVSQARVRGALIAMAMRSE